MKRSLCRIIAGILAAASLAACGSGCKAPDPGTGRLQIVATIFPEYDWVRNILGENPANIELTLLQDSGVDLHSFNPTVADILKVSSCDLFLYVGGESDSWVRDALAEAVKKDQAVVNLLSVLGDAAKEEETAEGMQEEAHAHGHEEGPEYDEHVWLSVKNAVLFVKTIAGAVQKMDPEHSGLYQNNAAAYLEKLSTLDAAYEAAVNEASVSTLLFGDRFPFRYLIEDYGLSYYAAFAGCSAESEASFETISFLARKVDELSLPAVLVIEGSDRRLAETIVSNTRTKDQRILVLDSMQSAGAKDVTGGTSYLDIMEKNLSVLKEALK